MIRLTHLDDRRRCPRCLHDLNERPYVMARRASENVIGWSAVAWIVAVALLAVVLTG